MVESLNKVKSKYPISILITNNISEKTEQLLKSNGLNVIRKDKITIPETIAKKNKQGQFSHWTNTFDKLLIFELTEFDKLVYLDSDMYILKNIDELFKRKNMSAVIDRRIGPIISKDWVKLTSGLMVIEPKKGVISSFMKIISEIENKRESIGDQDILQEYDNKWGEKEELHLDVKYNMFFPHIDYYTNYGNYTLDDICVVHFIYSIKPFQIKKEDISKYMNNIEHIKEKNYEMYKLEELKKHMLCGNNDEIYILKKYIALLEDINK